MGNRGSPHREQFAHYPAKKDAQTVWASSLNMSNHNPYVKVILNKHLHYFFQLELYLFLEFSNGIIGNYFGRVNMKKIVQRGLDKQEQHL